jgi:general secretion pathway protein J
MWHACRTERVQVQGGVSLLEILVALTIFAIASMIAYSGLNAVTSAKRSLDQEIRFWRELGQIFDRMEMDFVQIVPHVFRSNDGQLYPPLRGSRVGDAGFFIELARFDGERTPVQAFYRCDHGALRLRLEPINGRRRATTAATAEEPIPDLLQNVESCEAAYLDTNNTWATAWPGDQSAANPRAIRIGLTLAGRGRFERIYNLP